MSGVRIVVLFAPDMDEMGTTALGQTHFTFLYLKLEA